jgi:hypothetical protein
MGSRIPSMVAGRSMIRHGPAPSFQVGLDLPGRVRQCLSRHVQGVGRKRACMRLRPATINRPLGWKLNRLLSGVQAANGAVGGRREPAGQSPAAFRRASVRSVRSQEKSGSSRPKCPNAAVCA